MDPNSTKPPNSSNPSPDSPTASRDGNQGPALDPATFFRPRKPRGRSRMPKIEDAYEQLIKLGQVKIVRRRGKPPLIVWL